jgi:uncharacterized protein (DUF1810 family)
VTKKGKREKGKGKREKGEGRMAAKSGIDRFLDAQNGGEFETALAEIQAGRKLGHWIWYVFPQLGGLGHSHMSQVYGIRDRDEAVEYLRHPILRSRLQAITSAVAAHVGRGVRLEQLLGSSIDAQKLVSSLTLFGSVATNLETVGDTDIRAFSALTDEILTAAQEQGYSRCRYTLDRLGKR